jgi:hypothetical protein
MQNLSLVLNRDLHVANGRWALSEKLQKGGSVREMSCEIKTGEDKTIGPCRGALSRKSCQWKSCTWSSAGVRLDGSSGGCQVGENREYKWEAFSCLAEEIFSVVSISLDIQDPT